MFSTTPGHNPDAGESSLNESFTPPKEVTKDEPLIVRSPAANTDEVFDPSELMSHLGTPSQYESAIFVTIRRISEQETVKAEWGPSEALPDRDVIARPWLKQGDGSFIPAGSEYPLKIVEFEKRVDSGAQSSNGETLYQKPGKTSFFKVPEEYCGAIEVYHPEHQAGEPPQIPQKGDIIAFTESGPWVMKWNSDKFAEVVS